MNKLTLILSMILIGGFSVQAFAQPAGTRIPPRKEDHFMRKRIVSRIDLENKINLPLIQATSTDIYAETGFSNNQGIVAALINGMKEGKYVGYDPENLGKALTYDDAISFYKELEPDMEDTEWMEEDPFYLEEDEMLLDGENDADPMQIDEDAFGPSEGDENEIELAAFESVLEIIEDRIFDKNRSATVHDMQYIRLVWVDPGETLPDRHYLCFKYEDVMDVLENTRWTNKFNDAEDRNLLEIMELRLFDSYAINISGRGVKSLSESAYREQQLLEIEHNLWSY